MIPTASQADNEGSIPFTRSSLFKASSLPRVNKVSVKVSVSTLKGAVIRFPARDEATVTVTATLQQARTR
jgi:hypothetical protein